jgi:hypothetical protein
MRAFVAAEARHPFDLTRGPVWRVTLARLGDDDHLLLIVAHHIAFDGWSGGILFRELSALYGAFRCGASASLPDIAAQVVDYAAWQEQLARGDFLSSQLDYWKKQLAGPLPVLQLPADRSRPPLPTFCGRTEPIALSAELSRQLRELSRREGVTLFMTLLAAFQTLLARHSGQDDVLVGTSIADRPWEQLEGAIGMFLNEIVLRADLSDNPTFRELLARTRQTALDGYANADVPFETVARELRPERDPATTRCFRRCFCSRTSPSSSRSSRGSPSSLFPPTRGRRGST